MQLIILVFLSVWRFSSSIFPRSVNFVLSYNGRTQLAFLKPQGWSLRRKLILRSVPSSYGVFLLVSRPCCTSHWRDAKALSSTARCTVRCTHGCVVEPISAVLLVGSRQDFRKPHRFGYCSQLAAERISRLPAKWNYVSVSNAVGR